ncbi:MAG TPA: hypothetical protein VFP46_00530 [Candidatus Paceibacterota bacterium]|nr:hypothetical protein [Candidatus Paceibacterota bacterium]
MALLPSVPTSFVPHTPAAPSRSSDTVNIFSYIAYGILLISFVMAIGVFAYGEILKGQVQKKDAELSKAEAAIDTSTVEGFVRLRDRLAYASDELKAHVAFSNFFTALGTILPTTVRFGSLHLAMDPTGAAVVDGSGIAKSFNALASFSNAIAEDGRIKSAIFSKISVRGDGTVSFAFTASIDPKLIVFSAKGSSDASAQEQPQPEQTPAVAPAPPLK